MKQFLAGIAACVIVLPMAASAGIPVATQLTCPIGGEKFDITETALCSNSSDRRMSFAPTSSCDFISRLPQCPGNLLPMYKDFSEEELDLLRDYMLSESYDSNIDRSRYYLAYIIEKYLSNDPAQAFWLLLSGLWYDHENAFSNPIFMDAFFFEAIGEMNRVPASDLPYVQAVTAFAYATNDQPDQAQALLEKAKSANISEGILPTYISRIETCMVDAQNKFCQPNQLISAE